MLLFYIYHGEPISDSYYTVLRRPDTESRAWKTQKDF